MSNTNNYTGDLIIPFIQLLPFIKDDKVMKIYRTAQYNKSITKILIRCIATANSSVSITWEEWDQLYTLNYYYGLQRLIQVL